ncbi:hypothetical protein SAY87_004405 [Trapa incisa]|uniref:3'-5' exonuclease domain-containing protein n=1 Tax=Trapa incisa TaxID=236973 RepID=A0AAN7JSJ3_9MYRT|nr:hypothetical protein SAY87_004405 [Trapa incisa]
MMAYEQTANFQPRTATYRVKFAGRNISTVVTNEASVIVTWVRRISSMYAGKPMVVGLDVEWKPHELSWMSNKSATLQLCIDEECLIIQLFYVDRIPDELKNFLMDANFNFVGIEVGDDVGKLRDEYGLNCRKIADIREAAKVRWPGRFYRPGLKDLAWEVAGLYMVKPMHVVKSNWQERCLRVEQVEYVCIDAYASYKIGHILFIQNKCLTLGRVLLAVFFQIFV